MKNLKNKILEELSDTERGNNVLIDKTINIIYIVVNICLID